MKIISFELAKELNLTRFFTGEPCKNGHVAERLVYKKRCVECKRLREQRWYDKDKTRTQRHREKVRNNPTNKEYMSKYISNRWIDKKQELQQYNTEYSRNNKELLKEKRDNEYATKNGRARKLLSGAKSRAKKQGLDFNLDITDIVIPDMCPVFNIPILLLSNADHYHRPSLDRVDNTKGYIKGNVCVISNKANMMKNSLTIQDMELLIKYIKSFNQ